MFHRIAAKITGVAGYVPPRTMTNDDLAKIVETNDEWIRTRTGIRERHVVAKGMASSHMATEAAKCVLQITKTDAADIDLIVVASVTPDMFFPATACLVQDRIGANKAWGFDLSAACSGFAYALTVSAQFVGAGTHKKALVIGSDTATARVQRWWNLRALTKASSTSSTTWTVLVGSIFTCRAAARSIPQARKPSRRKCTTCIRKVRRFSNTPFGAWPILQRIWWNAMG